MHAQTTFINDHFNLCCFLFVKFVSIKFSLYFVDLQYVFLEECTFLGYYHLFSSNNLILKLPLIIQIVGRCYSLWRALALPGYLKYISHNRPIIASSFKYIRTGCGCSLLSLGKTLDKYHFLVSLLGYSNFLYQCERR